MSGARRGDSRLVQSVAVLRIRARGLALMGSLWATTGCTDEEPLTDRAGACSIEVWAVPHRIGERLQVTGSWDQWRAPIAMRDFPEGGWQVAELALPPGVYEYLVLEEGQGRVDRYNPLTSFREQDGLTRAVVSLAAGSPLEPLFSGRFPSWRGFPRPDRDSGGCMTRRR